MLHQPELAVSLGQATSPGPKRVNDDFHGALLPDGTARALKGMVFAVADGISTSKLSREAAQTAVKSLMSDYMATPESWTVKTAISRIVSATNSWLHAQSNLAGIGDADYGYVCTLSALILKGGTAHIFHVGDSRVWHLSGTGLVALTKDHRVCLDTGTEVLSRALGADMHVEIDYITRPVCVGDVFLLSTDGLHEHWNEGRLAEQIGQGANLDEVARDIVDATAPVSDDNLTLQIVRVDSLPAETGPELTPGALARPIPAHLAAGRQIDGYTIVKEIHVNHRSQLFLAETAAGERVALKVPTGTLRDDEAALRRFMCEEWIARRISNPHVMSAPPGNGTRSGLYTVTEFLEGKTLRQWMHDTPDPDFCRRRDIIGQIIRGLRAFHRREMLHQDLRPENIMIDAGGGVKLIDFGSVYVAGVQEYGPRHQTAEILGTAQYTAPEYFTGEPVSWRSDQFSLGVLAYELFTGDLPYGAEVAKITTGRQRRRLRYVSAAEKVPVWLDHALRKAVHPDPARRYDALSEFETDLKTPNNAFLNPTQPHRHEQDAVRFWQTLSLLLALICLFLFFYTLTEV